jgi:hypothetical protein
MLDDLQVLAEDTHKEGDDRGALHFNNLRTAPPNAQAQRSSDARST